MALAQPTQQQTAQIDQDATSIAESEWTKFGLQVGQDIGSYTSGPAALLKADVEDKLIATYPGLALTSLSQAAQYGVAQAAATLGPGQPTPSLPASVGGTIVGGASDTAGAVENAGSAVASAVSGFTGFLSGIWTWIQDRLVRLGLILAGAVLIVLAAIMLAKASGVSVPTPVPVPV